MKNIFLTTLLLISLRFTQAQDFPGFRASAETGVNGVFFNPATMAGSRYGYDVNVFSFSALSASDQASYGLSDLSRTFQPDSLKQQLFGSHAGPATGMVSMDVHGPSVMFRAGKYNAIAMTTRARLFANAVGMDSKLLDKISEDFSNDPSLPYTFGSDGDMQFSVHGWTEAGLSFARVFHLSGAHFMKAGMTVKYLAGAGNGFVDIGRFNGTIDDDLLLQDVFLRNTTGRIATGFGGMRVSGFEAADLLQMESAGFGADLGLVYEFRSGGTAAKEGTAGAKDYTLKVGVAVTDVGSIRYKKDRQRSGTYDIDITGNERLSLRQLQDLDVDDYNAFFGSRPQYFTPAASNVADEYTVSLPSTLQIDADLNLTKGFYMSVASQLSLSNNDEKAFNNRTYSGFALVPRYESRVFTASLPVTYNALSKLVAGASFRVGPVFFGSGSVISALFGGAQQADVHLGVRVRGKRRE